MGVDGGTGNRSEVGFRDRVTRNFSLGYSGFTVDNSVPETMRNVKWTNLQQVAQEGRGKNRRAP